ncbi:MAG TPA: G1 family glutamic endopeptidase [Acetobacteraceae bacterium]|nr:G1 family glutamic endopeptidase [Acetobacteraceae bacterium]
MPEWLVEQLRKRFTPYPPPEPRRFNPAEKSTEELLEIGLPPRPDATRQRLARELWDEAFDKEVTIVPFVFDEAMLQSIGYQLLNRQVDAMPIEETRFETSSNWSGVYITGNRDRQFMQLWGVWTVPEQLDLPPGNYQGPVGLPYVCSNWIGLDGQRLYLDSSLPQIGTANTLNLPGPPIVVAWIQWWARGNTTTVPLPIGLTVHPGDEVLAVLTAIDPQTVNFVMANLTTGDAMPAKATAPPVTLPNGTTVYPSIAGATAEWIVERPKVLHSEDRCNFPNYHTSDFSYCFAIEAEAVNITSLLDGIVQKLRGERMIRMFDVLGNPQRTAFISMPRKTSDTSIHLDWGGFFS